MSWEIRQGDSLRLLADLEDNTVGAVVTDPPYSSGGLHRGAKSGSAKNKYLSTGSEGLDRLPDFFGDNRGERALGKWATLWLSEAWRVTKPGGAIACFCDWRSFPVFADALQCGGWTWRGAGVWAKPRHTTRPVMGGLWNSSEFVLWGSKGQRDNTDCLPGHWETPAPASKTRLHVTEKPQEVLTDLVRLAGEDEMILDPFCGSGSTGLAALTQGRHFTGFEISKEYAKIAADRLKLFEAQGSDLHTVGTDPTLFVS